MAVSWQKCCRRMVWRRGIEKESSRDWGAQNALNAKLADAGRRD
ncbi:MAG: hypothetical protein ACLTBV_09595 [Enterocloster bolteae]